MPPARLTTILCVAKPDSAGHHALVFPPPGARVDAIHRRDLQFLSLRTAAAVAHIQLIGMAPSARHTLAMQRILEDVAQAIAVLAPIYAKTEGAGMALIPDTALLSGRFRRGAAVLVQEDGSKHTGLMVQRRDLDAAVSILKRTQLPETLRAVRARQPVESND